MESSDSERIRQLKLAAKWSSDNDEKRQAISQLLEFGGRALPAIQEILAVTAYDEIRQACLEAISELGRKQKQARDSRPKRAASGRKRTNRVKAKRARK
jgi:hypothetical protein